ncbi:hypothetical protein DMA11_00610 [Marinilabiliaceae bacterium JC017]|nr:hypothetical protein DMA11_00610 [Marinilabiliaceae bacterium JC017]
MLKFEFNVSELDKVKGGTRGGFGRADSCYSGSGTTSGGTRVHEYVNVREDGSWWCEYCSY